MSLGAKVWSDIKKFAKMATISKICHIDPIFHVHILGIYVHISARYEVSVINAVTGTAVHRRHQQQCP